ncbi:MAG: Holliday junction resolvase RuvX [Patescibacteria group bacterium]
MRLVGLDYGESRIGLAVSDELGLTAQGFAVYKRKGGRADLAALAAKVREIGAGLLVVGLPLNMNGSRGPAAEAAEEFGRGLARLTGLEVVFVDERLSTAQAAKSLIAAGIPRRRRGEVVDRNAAALILQAYLDRIGRPASDRARGEE